MIILRTVLAAGILAGSIRAEYEANRVSHMNQDPRDHVVLSRESDVTGGCGLQQSDFFRIYPDGTKDTLPFRVDEGHLLVVTDVDWWLADFQEPQPKPDNNSTYFTLALRHAYGGGSFSEYRVFRDEKRDDFQGRLGNSVGMTTGFVVGPDTPICPDAQVSPTSDTDILRLEVILRGYLIKDAKARCQKKSGPRR
jgi:hypothetical protein